jgi:hypothetical protein
MLFTNIQPYDFQPTLARFIERLEIEGAEEHEWIMMGIVNIASIMEYGRPGGVLRKVGCVGSKEVGGHGPQAASESDAISSSSPIVVPKAELQRRPSVLASHQCHHPLSLDCPCRRHQHPSFITHALVELGSPCP